MNIPKQKPNFVCLHNAPNKFHIKTRNDLQQLLWVISLFQNNFLITKSVANLIFPRNVAKVVLYHFKYLITYFPNLTLAKFNTKGWFIMPIYGVVRISTQKQNMQRQIRNIKAAYGTFMCNCHVNHFFPL